MKTIQMKCSSCGANLEADSDQNIIFCKYCGAKLMVDKEETTINYNNGAKIKDAEVRESLGKMSFFANAENRNRTHLMVILGVEWSLIFIIGMVIIGLLK